MKGPWRTDAEHPKNLLSRLRAGEPRALKDFVQLYESALFSFAFYLTGSREEAKRLTVETFLDAERALPQKEQTVGMETWLISLLLTSSQLPHAVESGREKPSDLVSHGDSKLNQLVAMMLLELPVDCRATLILRDRMGWSYGAIAQATSASVPLVEARLGRSYALLADVLVSRLSGQKRPEAGGDGPN